MNDSPEFVINNIWLIISLICFGGVAASLVMAGFSIAESLERSAEANERMADAMEASVYGHDDDDDDDDDDEVDSPEDEGPRDGETNDPRTDPLDALGFGPAPDGSPTLVPERDYVRTGTGYKPV